VRANPHAVFDNRPVTLRGATHLGLLAHGAALCQAAIEDLNSAKMANPKSCADVR
jgi:hypothetical protein